jgi:hypothetical protein
MPLAFKKFAVRSQMSNYSADLVGWKSGVDGYIEIMQPELGLGIAGAHVDMRWLVAFV